MNFLKRLLGLAKPAAVAPPMPQRKAELPPIHDQVADEFMAWYNAQTKPAVVFAPDPALPIGVAGSRLFGPAYLAHGEEWPRGANGATLDFLAQIDLADCLPLDGYPREGLVQFFISRDDLFGADFDNPAAGDFLVRHIRPDASGGLHASPHIAEFDPSGIDDYSPSNNYAMRVRGVGLAARPATDRIDLSVMEAEERFIALPKENDLNPLYTRIDAVAEHRPPRHHTGGFPAFTQADIRKDPRNAHLDHVLLRLTSDEYLMWGDVGECVFMMRSSDLAEGDFGKVAYSWDCS